MQINGQIVVCNLSSMSRCAQVAPLLCLTLPFAARLVYSSKVSKIYNTHDELNTLSVIGRSLWCCDASPARRRMRCCATTDHSPQRVAWEGATPDTGMLVGLVCAETRGEKPCSAEV